MGYVFFENDEDKIVNVGLSDSVSVSTLETSLAGGKVLSITGDSFYP